MNDNYPIPGAITKKCGCSFSLIDEQPQWHTICDEHQRVLTLHTAIIRRNIAQGVLDER